MTLAPSKNRSYLPWTAIEAVLKQQRTEIEAIVFALPCGQKMVKTPKLLELISGALWNDTILTNTLFKIYVSVIFHACAERGEAQKNSEYFDRVIEDLKQQQKNAFNVLQTDDCLDTFMISYLNAYEYAIIKYLCCINKESPPPREVTEAILQMGPETVKQCKFEQLVTQEISEDNKKTLRDAQNEEDELKLQLDALKLE